MLLARCAIGPVKMQAARSLHAIAKNYASAAQAMGGGGGGGRSSGENVLALVRVVVSLLEECMEALQVGRPLALLPKQTAAGSL